MISMLLCISKTLGYNFVELVLFYKIEFVLFGKIFVT